MRRKQKLFTWSNAGIAFLLMIFIISLAVTVTIYFKPLYYVDMKVLDIPNEARMTESDVKENYDALISYFTLFNNDALTLPTLPMSDEGRIHFEDVKHIFTIIQYLCIATFIASAFFIYKKCKRQSFEFLKLTPLLFIFPIPIILGAAVFIDWDETFVFMHELLFTNDYWLFNPSTDPVINMLPDEFFMHALLLILVLVCLGGITCYIAYRKVINRRK